MCKLQTEGTSRRTPLSYSRTPITLGTPDTLEDGIKDISSDDEIKKKEPMPWEMRHYPEIARNLRYAYILETMFSLFFG